MRHLIARDTNRWTNN